VIAGVSLIIRRLGPPITIGRTVQESTAFQISAIGTVYCHSVADVLQIIGSGAAWREALPIRLPMLGPMTTSSTLSARCGFSKLFEGLVREKGARNIF